MKGKRYKGQKLANSWTSVRGAGVGKARAGNGGQAIDTFFIITVLSTFLILFSALQSVPAQTPGKKPVQAIPPQPSVEKRVSEVEKDVLRLEKQVNAYTMETLPEYLAVCDKKIPIVREDVRERFEREFFLILENRGLLTTIVKRYFKYLPMISDEIQRQSLPFDLIFLAVAESYLNPRSVSTASAAGMWQFIKETGKQEGLSVNDSIDERYNVKRSTQSALTHLKRLYGELNDWLLAMAAYNAGINRVKEAIENQNTRDFLDMYLNEETERYVFRIIALKELILNKERYGITVTEPELYKPLILAEIVLETDREIHSGTLAQAMEVSYRTFRINNLQIRRYKMPKGSYRINVPVEKKAVFLRNLRGYDGIKVL